MLDKHTSCVLGSMTSMASITLEEKRLKQLKQQLFGKEQPLSSQLPKPKIPAENPLRRINEASEARQRRRLSTNLQTIKVSPNSKQPPYSTDLADPISLKSDITKIIIFSFLALTVQLVLFFATKQGLISLFR